MKPSMAASIILIGILFGCAGKIPSVATPRPTDLTGPLVSSLEIPGDFIVRQHISVTTPQMNGDFEAIIQSYCGELTIIGFSPLGLKLFSVRQSGQDLEIDALQLNGWSFSPDRILLDVHRIYFYPIAQPSLEDGQHVLRFGTDPLRERWSEGRLTERSIPMEDEQGEQWLEIRYKETKHAIPILNSRWDSRDISLRNPLYEYELGIRTVSYQALSCEADRD